MADALLSAGLELAERGLIPDAAIRLAIRRLCGQRLREVAISPGTDRASLIADMAAGPVAPVPEAANAQHYEAPVELFEAALGPHLKYSCGYWTPDSRTLGDAEAAALALTAQHADLHDGQQILELGCGWGSMSLWMAERYPASRILGVSNSHRQREFIRRRAAERQLSNLEIVTVDMNDLVLDRRFDRVVSIEMFEHMRNYAELLRRIARWLEPDGQLLVHLFCHREYAYPYATDGAANWLGRHFFTGGLMPSADLLDTFDADLAVTETWTWDGTHYERTANAWLRHLDAARHGLLPVFARHYGSDQAARWLARWRMFFMACAELWGYDQGRQWQVQHLRLEPSARSSRRLDGRAA